SLFDEPVTEMPAPPVHELMEGSQGFVVRGLPVLSKLPTVSEQDGYICYVPLQYEHCYIDMSMSFVDYERKFSSKTRSTLKRKIRRYARYCGGELRWKMYSRPG